MLDPSWFDVSIWSLGFPFITPMVVGVCICVALLTILWVWDNDDDDD